MQQAFAESPNSRSGHYVAYVQRGLAAAAPAAAAVAASEEAPGTAANGPVVTPTAAGAATQPPTQAEPAGSATDAEAATPAEASAGVRNGDSNSSTAAGGQPEQLAWFRISDQHVKRISWAQVLAAEAYLLLYARCWVGMRES